MVVEEENGDGGSGKAETEMWDGASAVTKVQSSFPNSTSCIPFRNSPDLFYACLVISRG